MNELKNTHVYPTKKVILAYALTGGLLGSIITLTKFTVTSIFVSLQLSSLENHSVDWSNEIAQFIIIYGFGIPMGIILGTLPAISAGMYVALKKTVIRHNKEFLYLFMQIFTITVIVCMLVSFFSSDVNNTIDASVSWGILCGLCTVIIGWFVLPRRKS